MEDVCLEHSSPLITFGMCEDSPALKEVLEQTRKEARQEERQFILNVLDGIDIADGECNTQAIRLALQARAV